MATSANIIPPESGNTTESAAESSSTEANAVSDPARPDESIHVDLARKTRCGFPEAVYGEGKSLEQISQIIRCQLERRDPVLVTRIAEPIGVELSREFGGVHNPIARTFRISDQAKQGLVGRVPVVSAGTTDLPVVEETLETLVWMGVNSHRVMDVGVAGPHRLVERVGDLEGSDAIVVVAGMEGALPSVVAGYVDCPVIAVPTSVGYGANLGGVSALLSMLNSCAANVSVVNIDAGFKGAYVAGMIAHRAHRRKE